MPRHKDTEMQDDYRGVRRYNVSQVADLLRVTTANVYNKIQCGQIHAVKIDGEGLRVLADEWERLQKIQASDGSFVVRDNINRALILLRQVRQRLNEVEDARLTGKDPDLDIDVSWYLKLMNTVRSFVDRRRGTVGRLYVLPGAGDSEGEPYDFEKDRDFKALIELVDDGSMDRLKWVERRAQEKQMFEQGDVQEHIQANALYEAAGPFIKAFDGVLAEHPLFKALKERYDMCESFQ